MVFLHKLTFKPWLQESTINCSSMRQWRFGKEVTSDQMIELLDLFEPMFRKVQRNSQGITQTHISTRVRNITQVEPSCMWRMYISCRVFFRNVRFFVVYRSSVINSSTPHLGMYSMTHVHTHDTYTWHMTHDTCTHTHTHTHTHSHTHTHTHTRA